MAAYVVFNYKILDHSRIDELTTRVQPINEKYDAEVIVGSPVKTVEGTTLPSMVIYKFKDFQTAQDWFYCDEHQELSAFRHEITEGWATILPDVASTNALVNSDYFDSK